MKILRTIAFISLAALAMLGSAACQDSATVYTNTHPAYARAIVYDEYDYNYYGYEPYSWQWFYVRRHHHRPPYGYGRNLDRRDYNYHRGYNRR